MGADFADAPLEHDADAHYDAWFNQGRSVAFGPRAPKDIRPEDRVIVNDGKTVVNPAPALPSIRELVAQQGLTQPEKPAVRPGRRPLNQPAGFNRPDAGHDYQAPVSDLPIVEVNLPVNLPTSQPAAYGDPSGALLALLSIYMPAEQFNANPIVQAAMRSIGLR